MPRVAASERNQAARRLARARASKLPRWTQGEIGIVVGAMLRRPFPDWQGVATRLGRSEKAVRRFAVRLRHRYYWLACPFDDGRRAKLYEHEIRLRLGDVS